MRTFYRGEIDAPIERVFDLVERPDRRKQWMDGLEETTLLADERAKTVGAVFRQRVRDGRGVSEYAGEVTAYEHPRHLGIRIGNPSFVMQVDYRLTPIGPRTRLDYTTELVAGGALLRLVEQAFSWLTRRILHRQMRRLKTLAEASGLG